MSRYDDLIDERYHFPKIYLRTAQQRIGDWLLYHETGSAGGRMPEDRLAWPRPDYVARHRERFANGGLA